MKLHMNLCFDKPHNDIDGRAWYTFRAPYKIVIPLLDFTRRNSLVSFLGHLTRCNSLVILEQEIFWKDTMKFFHKLIGTVVVIKRKFV